MRLSYGISITLLYLCFFDVVAGCEVVGNFCNIKRGKLIGNFIEMGHIGVESQLKPA